jgi:hypothetical protein
LQDMPFYPKRRPDRQTPPPIGGWTWRSANYYNISSSVQNTDATAKIVREGLTWRKCRPSVELVNQAISPISGHLPSRSHCSSIVLIACSRERFHGMKWRPSAAGKPMSIRGFSSRARANPRVAVRISPGSWISRSKRTEFTSSQSPTWSSSHSARSWSTISSMDTWMFFWSSFGVTFIVDAVAISGKRKLYAKWAR